jgi:hypothetical protein
LGMGRRAEAKEQTENERGWDLHGGAGMEQRWLDRPTRASR